MASLFQLMLQQNIGNFSRNGHKWLETSDAEKRIDESTYLLNGIYIYIYIYIFQAEITYSSLCHKTAFIRLVCSNDPKNNKRCT